MARFTYTVFSSRFYGARSAKHKKLMENLEQVSTAQLQKEAIADASMSKFVSKLEYKCLWNGIEFERADSFFPSTKTCASCGNRKSHIGLDVRTYHCYSCGHVMDRDLNAAINLANYQTRIA